MCSYSRESCASRLEISPIALSNTWESLNSSTVVLAGSSSSSLLLLFSFGLLLCLASLLSHLPFLDLSLASSLSPPPGAPGAPNHRGGGWLPPPPVPPIEYSSMGSESFAFSFDWANNPLIISFISNNFCSPFRPVSLSFES